MEQTGLDEMAAVDRSRDDDFRALTNLVEFHAERIFRLALYFTRHRGDAEEVLQKTFAEAYEDLGVRRGNSELRLWLIRIAVRQALTTPRAPSSNQAPSDYPVGGEGPAATRSTHTNREIPDRALENLHPVLRAVFVLRDMEGIGTQDTAAMLHMPARTVRRRLLRARMQLRERLYPHFKTT